MAQGDAKRPWKRVVRARRGKPRLTPELALPEEATGSGRCHHQFVIKASSPVAAELFINGEPGVSCMLGGEGDELVQVAEDNGAFSGVWAHGG